MYAVCISDAHNLTDTCIRWHESYSEAEACAERWRGFYGTKNGIRILDENGVTDSKRRNRFRDYSDPSF